MTDLLSCKEKDTLSEKRVVKTVYDMTMDTSQMLECMEGKLCELDQKVEVTIF